MLLLSDASRKIEFRVVEPGASLSWRALNLEGFVAKDAKQNPERTFRHDYGR